MSEEIKLDADFKMFIGGILGESSLANSYDEMTAIAEVLIRQRKARGHTTWANFVKKESSFAFAFSDGNPRYALVIATKDSEVPTLEPIATAYRAATDATAGGTSFSNQAYFWDGYDFKTNTKHFKRKVGFKYGDPSHDIFGVPEEKKLYEQFKIVVKDGKKTKEVVAKADCVYISSAAIKGEYKKTVTVNQKDKNGKIVKVKVQKKIETGTIFWIMNPDYVKYFNGGKVYI